MDLLHQPLMRPWTSCSAWRSRMENAPSLPPPPHLSQDPSALIGHPVKESSLFTATNKQSLFLSVPTGISEWKEPVLVLRWKEEEEKKARRPAYPHELIPLSGPLTAGATGRLMGNGLGKGTLGSVDRPTGVLSSGGLPCFSRCSGVPFHPRLLLRERTAPCPACASEEDAGSGTGATHLCLRE